VYDVVIDNMNINDILADICSWLSACLAAWRNEGEE